MQKVKASLVQLLDVSRALISDTWLLLKHNLTVSIGKLADTETLPTAQTVNPLLIKSLLAVSKSLKQVFWESSKVL